MSSYGFGWMEPYHFFYQIPRFGNPTVLLSLTTRHESDVTRSTVWHHSQEFFRRTFQAHQKNRPRLLCTQPFVERFVSSCGCFHLSSIRYLSTRRILPPHMETPNPPNDTPKRASKQVATGHPSQHAKGFLENKTLAERPRFYPQVSMIW